MSNNYAGKFVSAETAVKAVQPATGWIMALALDFRSFSIVRWQHAGMS